MSTPRTTVAIGQAGEQAAVEALIRQGFVVLMRNWRTKYCEVDIIARMQHVIWFIEVKYRRTDSYGDGLDYISPAKLMHMQRAATLWTHQQGYDGEYTLGAVAVGGDNVVGDLVEV